MKAGGGKAKGSSFERTICKELSLWISNGKYGDIFWRSAMSGGRSTVSLKSGKKLAAQAGDISSIHRLGHLFIEQFIIECKAYKDLNFDTLIKGTGNLIDFWKRVSKDAEEYNKKPMLIAKQNHFPIVVCLNKQGALYFSKKDIKIKVLDYDLNIMLWKDFLNVNPIVMRRVRL